MGSYRILYKILVIVVFILLEYYYENIFQKPMAKKMV